MKKIPFNRRTLIIIFTVTLFLVFGGYYSVKIILKNYFDDKSSYSTVPENRSLLDSFLIKNYSFTLNLEKAAEERAGIYCENNLLVLKNGKIIFTCLNQNPAHKIIIGSVSKDEPYLSSAQAIGNQQLFWRNNPKQTTGNLSCLEDPDYLDYSDVLFGVNCTMKLVTGEKLYSSTVIFKINDQNQRVFISILNTKIITDKDKVKNELLYLLNNKKKPLSIDLFNIIFQKAYAEGSGGPGGDASCSAAGAAAEAAGAGCSDSPTGPNGGGSDATICDVSNPANCYPVYCDSPTAYWDTATNSCIEPAVCPANQVSVATVRYRCFYPQYTTGKEDTVVPASWGPWQATSPTCSVMVYPWVASTETVNSYTCHNLPSVPTSPQNVCNDAQGTSATISWGASTDADLGYYLRIGMPDGQPCPAGWVNYSGTSCHPPGDSYTSTSFNFTTIPGQSYAWWVHGRNSYGFSTPASSNFTCAAPATGTLTLSAPTCEIAIGASSCSVNATWSTSNPVGTSAITTDPSVTLYTANNGGPSAVSSTGEGSRTFYLYNNGTLLDQKTLVTSCANGGSYVGGVCVAPAVDPVPTVTVSWLTNPITVGGTSNIVISSTDATACYGTAGSIWVGNLGGTATGPSGVSSPVMNTEGDFPQGVYCTGPGGTSPTVIAVLNVDPLGVCANGGTDYPTCTPPATCQNGATNPPTCTIGATSVCGPLSSAQGAPAQVTEPVGANACSGGAFGAASDDITTWIWNCGAIQCSVAKGVPAGIDCPATPVTWGSCTGITSATNIPVGLPSSYTSAVDVNSYSVAGSYVGSAQYTCTSGVLSAPTSQTCNQILCTVATDASGYFAPCTGVCANGGTPYPSCPQPTDPDLIGGVVDILGHPKYTLGSVQVIDILSGQALTLNGNIRNQGINSTLAPFNNYIELTTLTYGAMYMPPVNSYSRVGSAINTAALAGATSRVVSTTDTLTLTPSIDLTAPGFPAPGSKMYYLRTCADRNSPTDTTGVIDELSESNNCTNSLTFLNVLAPPTGTLTSSVPSCVISTAASSCTTDLTWTTSGTTGVVEVTTNNPSATNPVFTGPSGGPSTTSITGIGPTTFYLYNSSIELANTTVTTSCEGTNGGWDTVSGTCRDPEVVSATITGQYYPPGTLELTCNRSNSYSVTLNGVTITSGAYTVPITYNAITLPGSYVIRCMYGSVSAQVARPYDSFPPAAEVDLKIVPTTITEEDDVVVTWDTQYPTNACTLSARIVCANNACTASQLLEATKLNTILNSTTTDFNDPGTSRLLQNAIKQVRPGGVDVDWRAIGKKTLNIRYTTDFTYDCNGVRSTRRVQVTKSEEQ
jgi:hypothetical protein